MLLLLLVLLLVLVLATAKIISVVNDVSPAVHVDHSSPRGSGWPLERSARMIAASLIAIHRSCLVITSSLSVVAQHFIRLHDVPKQGFGLFPLVFIRV